MVQSNAFRKPPLTFLLLKNEGWEVLKNVVAATVSAAVDVLLLLLLWVLALSLLLLLAALPLLVLLLLLMLLLFSNRVHVCRRSLV